MTVSESQNLLLEILDQIVFTNCPRLISAFSVILGMGTRFWSQIHSDRPCFVNLHPEPANQMINLDPNPPKRIVFLTPV